MGFGKVSARIYRAQGQEPRVLISSGQVVVVVRKSGRNYCRVRDGGACGNGFIYRGSVASGGGLTGDPGLEELVVQRLVSSRMRRRPVAATAMELD